MSYRHSSYRKVKKVIEKTLPMDSGQIANLPRHEMDRVLCWTGEPPLPKPLGWGKPKGWRA